MSKKPQGMGRIKMAQKPKSFRKSIAQLAVSLKAHLFSIFIGLLFATLSTVLAIIGPDQIQKIASLLIGAQIDFAQITKLAIGLVILYSCSFLFAFVQSFIMNGVTAKISRDFRSRLLNKVNNLPLKYLDSVSHGDVLSRITNDVDTLSEALGATISELITALTTIVGSIIMMFTYSLNLTLVALIIIPVSMIVASIMFRFSQNFFKTQQEKLGQINGHIEEIYSGHNIISVFNAEREVTKTFDDINKQLYLSNFKGQLVTGLFFPVLNFLANIGYALIIILGGIMSLDNPAFIAYVVSFTIYYRMFNNQIGKVANLSGNVQTALASSERVFEFLQENEQISETDKPKFDKQVLGNIEFENVNFGYSADKQILFDLNLKIKKGQKVAIVGATGAGKTTLVNLLMRFYDIDSGRIVIDGVNISDVQRESVRALFGMVLQDTWLFEGTIKENIAYGKKNVTNKEVVEVCKIVGIDHLIMSQPKNYDMILSEETTFSAGERQLITIARAMLSDAPMIILDEATSSVDTRTEVLIQSAMNKLMKGRTTFVIAHRLSTIVSADQIVVMKDGKVVETGKHEDLLIAGGVYANLYNSQF